MAERKTYEELTFCDDFMFCKVLEDDPELCKALLEVILGHKIRGHVQVRKQASIDHSALSHGVRFDVFAMDKNGIAYDVEMQQAGSPKELPKRSRYQQSMMDLELLRPGEAYGRLRKSYVIFICRFNMYPRAGDRRQVDRADRRRSAAGKDPRKVEERVYDFTGLHAKRATGRTQRGTRQHPAGKKAGGCG